MSSGIGPYYGKHLYPGTYPEVETFENEFVAGRWENHQLWKLVIDGSATDPGHTANPSVLRAGVLMAQLTTNPNMMVPWVQGGANGAGTIIGLLYQTTNLKVANGTANRLSGPLIISGLIRPEDIIEAALTNKGISGNPNEQEIRNSLVKIGFKLTDDLSNSQVTIFAP